MDEQTGLPVKAVYAGVDAAGQMRAAPAVFWFWMWDERSER